MTSEVVDLLHRALRSIRTADELAGTDPDAAASRAYYAVFYAVSGIFAQRGTAFVKHSALETAVHRDLVKQGTWSQELGAGYSWLCNLRTTGDYGGESHVTVEQARKAVHVARSIVQAVRDSICEPLPDELSPS